MPVDDRVAQLNKAIQQAAENIPAAGSGTDAYSQAISELGGIYPSTLQRFAGTVATGAARVGIGAIGGIPQTPGVAVGTAGQALSSAVSTFVGDQPFAITPSGNMVFPNGVVVSPDGQVLPGPWMNDPDVEGSNAWLRKIQDEWSDAKFNTWRKRLINMGYGTASGLDSSGGQAKDILTALQEFHFTRYVNGGKPIRLIPEQKAGQIREVVDFKAVKEDVGSWLDAVGFDRDDDVQEFFAQQVMRTANRLMTNKGWSPEMALSGAQLRTQEKFVKQPGVRSELKELEEDEMDESLREDAISIFELGAV